MQKKLTLSLLAVFLCFAKIGAQPTAPLPAFLRDSLDTYVNRALKLWDMWRSGSVATG